MKFLECLFHNYVTIQISMIKYSFFFIHGFYLLRSDFFLSFLSMKAESIFMVLPTKMMADDIRNWFAEMQWIYARYRYWWDGPRMLVEWTDLTQGWNNFCAMKYSSDICFKFVIFRRAYFFTIKPVKLFDFVSNYT